MGLAQERYAMAGRFRSMSISFYGRTSAGTDVQRITLGGPGLQLAVLTFGAAIERLDVPDRAGRWANVVLGLPDLDGYERRSPHFGAVPGRYAGRIAGGRFTLDGAVHDLPRNDGPNTLHGGPTGFGRRVWTIEDSGERHVTLGLLSTDGDAGFPGALHARITYTAEESGLRLEYAATTDRATVLNLTNHSYFNLAGEGSGTVLDHVLHLHADAFLPMDETAIPTGEVRPVDGTPFDFRTPTPLGERIRAGDEQLVRALGYDQCFLLRGTGLRPAARLLDPVSGRVLEVMTDQPALQLYTANKLTGALVGPSGRAYRSGDAVCLETQHYPDSPNHPHFPTTVLRRGETFASTTVFRFGAG